MSSTDSSERILLVDDDREHRLAFASWLRERGYDVLEAENGQEGLKLARDKRPLVAVVEVMMPLMSGWDLCREIKQGSETSSMQVLVLTSIGAELNQMTSPQYGADAYMDKPADIRDVEATIRRLLTSQSSSA